MRNREIDSASRNRRVTDPGDTRPADRGISCSTRAYLPRSAALAARSILLFRSSVCPESGISVTVSQRPAVLRRRSLSPPPAFWQPDRPPRKMFRIGLKFPCNGLTRVRRARGKSLRVTGRVERIPRSREKREEVVTSPATTRRRPVSRANLRSPPSSAVREIDDDGHGRCPRRWRQRRRRGSPVNDLKNLGRGRRSRASKARDKDGDTGYKRAYIIPEALTVRCSFRSRNTAAPGYIWQPGTMSRERASNASRKGGEFFLTTNFDDDRCCQRCHSILRLHFVFH